MGRVKRLLDHAPSPDAPEYALYELLQAITPTPIIERAQVDAMACLRAAFPHHVAMSRTRTGSARRSTLRN